MKKQPSPEGCFFSYIRGFAAGYIFLPFGQKANVCAPLSRLPRRSPLVLRLFALALADGSGLPFSLYPPPAALESQTPQREARALPRRALKSTASERKIVTKETHQGCLSFLFKSPLPCKGEARALPRRAQIWCCVLFNIPHSELLKTLHQWASSA